jgi:hypothetical protein
MTTIRDQEEQDLRIDQMTINIEKMRTEMRWETRKFVVQVVLAAAALFATGIAVGRFFLSHP